MEPSEFRAVNSRSYLLLLIIIGIVGLDFLDLLGSSDDQIWVPSQKNLIK